MTMQSSKITIGCLMLMLFVAGCTNTIYFYETEKISLTLEGKAADAAAPIMGNLGIKQRVVAVVPSREASTPTNTQSSDGSGKADASADAMAMISYFDFKKRDNKPGEAFWLDPVTIETAFITGRAARCLTSPQATQAFQSIAGIAKTIDLRDVAAIERLYSDLSNLANDGNDPKAARHVAAINELAFLALPACIPIARYTWTPGADPAVSAGRLTRPGQLTEPAAAADPKMPKGDAFKRLRIYLSTLSNSVKALQEWNDLRADTKQNKRPFNFELQRGDAAGSPTFSNDASDVVDVKATLARQSGLKTKIGRILALDNVIYNASRYYIQRKYHSSQE